MDFQFLDATSTDDVKNRNCSLLVHTDGALLPLSGGSTRV